jgi:hypothetical protein
MGVYITAALAGFGRRAAFCGAIAAAVGFAIWALIRHGRHQAEADLAIRKADARGRAMQISKEVHHEVGNADRADLDRRAKRWMRD